MRAFRSTKDRLIGLVFGGVFSAIFVTTVVHIVLRYLAPPAPDVGDVAPAFALDSPIDGQRIATESLSGMVLLIDFWETTCVGCVGATPKLNRLFERYRDRGFLVIGVNREPDRVAEVKAFVAERPVNYPVVIDPGEVSSAYGIYATPTVVIIGADGKIRNKHTGAVTEHRLEQDIEAALQAAQPRFGQRLKRSRYALGLKPVHRLNARRNVRTSK